MRPEKLTITVDNRLRFPADALPRALVERVVGQFTYDNPVYKRAMGRGMYPPRGEPRVIRAWRLGDQPRLPPEPAPLRGELSLPRGGMSRLREELRSAGVAYRVEDRRSLGDGSLLGWSLDPGLSAFDYQDEAVGAFLGREQGILRMPTGSGKTEVAIMLMAALGLPTLVVVWRAKLLDQWVARVARWFRVPEARVGVFSGRKRRLGPITVAMQQSLVAPGGSDVLPGFGFLVCDEVQRFGARTFVDVVDRSAARYRLGLSDDERRTDQKNFLIYDQFGSVLYSVDRAVLEERGAVLPVMVRAWPTDFRAPWYDDARAAGAVTDVDSSRLIEEMSLDERRTALAVGIAVEESRAGHSTVILSHRVEHCLRVDAAAAAAGVPCGLLLGGVEHSRRYDQSLAGLRSGSLRLAVATYQAFGVGQDVDVLSRGVLATPIANNDKFFRQVRGRFCRVDRTTGRASDRVLHVLWDRHVYGARMLEQLIRWNRDVQVRDGDSWADGRPYLRRYRNEHRQ